MVRGLINLSLGDGKTKIDCSFKFKNEEFFEGEAGVMGQTFLFCF